MQIVDVEKDWSATIERRWPGSAFVRTVRTAPRAAAICDSSLTLPAVIFSKNSIGLGLPSMRSSKSLLFRPLTKWPCLVENHHVGLHQVRCKRVKRQFDPESFPPAEL